MTSDRVLEVQDIGISGRDASLGSVDAPPPAPRVAPARKSGKQQRRLCDEGRVHPHAAARRDL